MKKELVVQESTLESLDETDLASVRGGLSISYFMALFAALRGPAEHGPGGSPADGTVPGDGYAGP